MKLDKTKAYGTIWGHESASFEQGGVLFDAGGFPIGAPVKDSRVIVTDNIASAGMFLNNVLSGGPLAKAVLYKEAENNNQAWDKVKEAADLIGVVRYTTNKVESWRLPEKVTE